MGEGGRHKLWTGRRGAGGGENIQKRLEMEMNMRYRGLLGKAHVPDLVTKLIGRDAASCPSCNVYAV